MYQHKLNILSDFKSTINVDWINYVKI
jgi:hypothetical protein